MGIEPTTSRVFLYGHVLYRCATAPALTDSLDELVEEHGALPDDPRGLGLLILTPAEGQAVVHAAFLMEDNLLLFNKTNSLLLHLVSLKRDIWVQCGQMARLYVQYLAI